MFFRHLAGGAVEVHKNQRLSAEGLTALTERNLVRAVRHAGRHVPFYRESFRQAGVDVSAFRGSSDLEKLPFITKDQVRAAFPDTITADGTDIEACHYSATTGSTGRSLPFVYSPKTFAFYLATNLRVYTMIGYRPWHRCCYIKYTAMDPVAVGPLFRFYHIPSVMPVDEQIALLLKHRPDFLDGYASIVYEIARKITPPDLARLRLKMILVNSEMSSPAQRDFISRVFGCPVYDEYSTEETWMVASQCRHHNYHLFTDNVFVECLDPQGRAVPPGEPGEIVLTTLKSPAMPFIRYRIGDIGRLSTRTCACGSPFPLMEAFDGRADDSFILPDGTYVSSLKILNTFTMFIKKYLHLMEEFKVIQTDRDRVVIDLVRGKDYDPARFKEVKDALDRLFKGQVTLCVRMVEAIETGGSIKRKAIESRVSRPDQRTSS
ncbi:phenylacetate--CoA ligase family protein [Desulfatiferula olefinivorans]